MTPRRILSVLGPALALGAFASGLACGCMPWSLDLPGAAGFVGRGLADSYGVALTAQGRTAVSLLPLPRIAFSDVRLTAGSPDGPVLAKGGDLTLQLSLASLLVGRVEVVSLTLDGAAVTLPESDDDARWDGPLRRLSEAFSGPDPAHPRRITLRRATVTGRDPRDGRPETAREVDLTLSWPLWSDTLDLAGGLTWNCASARFTLTGLRPGDLLDGRDSPFSAALTWPAGSLAAEGSGRLKGGVALAGQARLHTGSLPETLAWIGGDVALSPLIETFSVDGRFELSGESLRLPSMRVTAGGTVLEGAGSAEMSGRRPSIRATLDARDLNLAPALGGLMRVAGLDGQGDWEAGSGQGWGRRSLALAPLTGGDLDLRLSSGSARLGPLVLEDLAASVMVRANGIDATLGRASLRGGTLKGRLALATPRDVASDETELKAQGAFEGLDLGALLVDLGESSWVLGATRGSFTLEGRGRDADGLVRRIAGRAVLSVESGTIAGLDLADVVHRGGAVAPGALARRNGRTGFDRAGISLVFNDGVGEIDEGGLAARTLTASLRGRLSLPERRFLARAALLPRKGAGDRGAGDRGAGEATPVPAATLFEIAGPWDAVAVRPMPRDGRAESAEALLSAPASALPGLPSQVRAYAP